ncbi:MAG: translation initiation factor IF-6 [Candidatus Aenigmatarchaeota archaeon]
MQIFQLNFHGDPNLGIYAKACDKFCLVGYLVLDVFKIEDMLKVKVKRVTIANTDFVGMLSAFNSHGILISKIVNENEMKSFNEIEKEFNVRVEIVPSRFSALGNLILCNDKGAVISKLFGKKEKEIIENCLDVEVVSGKIASLSTVGSCGIATNQGCLVHRDAKEEEIKLIEDVLKVQVDIGTANFGSPFVGSCIISNSNGALVGLSTTAPEISRIGETLNLF